MDYSVAADLTGCLWEDRFVYSFRAAQSNQTYVFLHQSEISDDAFDLHLRSNAVALHMTLLDTIDQLCLGVRFLLFFLHKSSLLAFKYKFWLFFLPVRHLYGFDWLIGEKRGKGETPSAASVDGDGDLAGCKAKIWASKWNEPSVFKTPGCF